MGIDAKNDNVITEDVVRYVAILSRLKLKDGDLDKFKGQLSDILNYIDQLNEVDTEGVLPTTHVLPSMKNVFREDVKKDSLPPEEGLQNAPAKKDNFFKVPRIIKDA